MVNDDLNEGPTRLEERNNNVKNWSNNKRPRRDGNYANSNAQVNGTKKQGGKDEVQAGVIRVNNSERRLKEVVDKGEHLKLKSN